MPRPARWPGRSSTRETDRLDLTGLVPATGNLAWTIVFFVVALSVIVTIHELGHYLVGRWCGIAAEVFSIGMGPTLWSRTDRHGTRWQIAALPLGGYVKFLGDADAASGPDAEALAGMDAETRRKTVHAAPLWARSATVAAGPIFNFILSIAIFAGVILVQGTTKYPITIDAVSSMPPGYADGLHSGDVISAIDGTPVPDAKSYLSLVDSNNGAPTMIYTIERDGGVQQVEAPNIMPPLVGAVTPDSAANDIGIRTGDVIESVDGAPIKSFKELQDKVAASAGKPVLLKVWRDGEVMDFTLVPRRTDLPLPGGRFETRYLIGVTNGPLFTTQTTATGIGTALTGAVNQTWQIVVSSISGLYHIAVGSISSCGLQGPIGIAKTSGAAASMGVTSFIWFIAVLSTAVGLLNLFPVPILDGGHLLFHAYEAIVGRAPGDRALKAMMSVGLVLLLALMVYAVTNDLRCP